MLGINQISWSQFANFILTALILWYLGVILLAFIRQRSSSRKILFEEDSLSHIMSEGLETISISAQDYPSEIIPFHLAENIPLPVSFYEETGLNEGYCLDRFLKPDDSLLPELMDQIQYQQ